MIYLEILILLIPLIFAMFAAKKYNFIHGIITFFTVVTIFTFISFLSNQYSFIKLPEMYTTLTEDIVLLELLFDSCISRIEPIYDLIGETSWLTFGAVFGVYIISLILSKLLRSLLRGRKN